MNATSQWQAVLARDARFDGSFVYGVRSTGIYCRPTCASRRPRRDRVRFFSDPVEAEQAGFRACRRCKPKASAQDPRLESVRRACDFIAADPDRHPTLAAIGEHVGLSPYHLQRTFKKLTGVSPREYAEACRVQRLKTGLRSGRDVTRALYDAGYGSSSRLYESADRVIGMTPGRYRRGGEGLGISYTVTVSSLGRLLVAATERGICAVKLGDRVRELEADLRREYPAASIRRDRGLLEDVVATLVAHMEGREPHLDLPVDVRASAFQWSVWRELRRIPYGETRSYAEVAKAIGKPTAVRAVARACATNPVAVVIPCHRVIGSNGKLTGYRWGTQRKQALIDGEQQRARRRDDSS